MKLQPPNINGYLEKKDLTDVFDEVDDLNRISRNLKFIIGRKSIR
ncbi:hypothetical protein [Staphylococcus shinii]|nr:hypothetical protein [Staphylococcus shinii]MDW8571413.1 hypothetical protein [Staphylococcus shinii]